MALWLVNRIKSWRHKVLIVSWKMICWSPKKDVSPPSTTQMDNLGFEGTSETSHVNVFEVKKVKFSLQFFGDKII